MQDIPKLYTALAEWLACVTAILIYRNLLEEDALPIQEQKMQPQQMRQQAEQQSQPGREQIQQSPVRRRRICILAGRLVLALVILCILQQFCGYSVYAFPSVLSNVFWLSGMAAAVITMTWLIARTLRLSLPTAVYTTTRMFLYAELTAAFEWQLFYYYSGGAATDSDAVNNTAVNSAAGTPYRFPGIVICIAFYCGMYLILYLAEKRILSGEPQRSWIETEPKQALLTALLGLVVFTLSNISYVSVRTPFTGTGAMEIFNIRTLMDLAGFLMVEGLYIQKVDDNRRRENDSIKAILRTQYMQYRESQENIDLINRKYHDLKQQLQVIRQETNDARREAYVQEIEAGLNKYEAENKTGNPVLDTILTSKSNLCLKYQITMTVVADGHLLNSISVMDLCTIFGNALDNAIEYEVQIPQTDKRLIHVSVSARRSLVCILVENYYEGPAVSSNVTLQTTKADKHSHGFGVKSIRYAVDKYGGHCTTTSQDNWFRLQILLPKT